MYLRRIQTFSLDRLTGREKNNMYSSMILSPDYSPNFEQGKKRLAVSIVPFTKILPRKVYQVPNATENEEFFNFDFFAKEQANKGKSQLFKRIPAFQLEKQLPRETDFLNKLPSFMQKTMNGRMTLNSLTQKTLELNNYSQSPCQSIISSFQLSRPKMTKQNIQDSVKYD